MWNKIGWALFWLNIASAAFSLLTGRYLLVLSGIASAAMMYYVIRTHEDLGKLFSGKEKNND